MIKRSTSFFESSSDDLSLGLDAAFGNAATSLRSIETHPSAPILMIGAY